MSDASAGRPEDAWDAWDAWDGESASSPRGPGEPAAPPELASVWRRLFARIIDHVILFFAVLALRIIGWLGSLSFSGLTWDQRDDLVIDLPLIPSIVVVAVAVQMIYEVSFIAVRGQTPGKMLTEIMVVDADGRGFPGWRAAFVRWGLPFGLGVIPLLGWLLGPLAYAAILWDPRHQGWHDRAANTLVVEAPPR